VEQGPEALSLAEVLALLRRRAPLIFGCTLLVAIATFGFSKLQTEEYTATASLVFDSDPLSQQIAGLPPSTSTNQFVEQASNIALVGLGDVAAKTAERVGHGLTEAEVRESISVSGEGESTVVAVSATSTSPLLAAELATIYTHQFVREQQRAKERFFASALALVNKQLAELPADQQYGTAAVALQNRAQSLRLLQRLRADNVSVAQDAPVPSAPSSPQTAKNTMIGGILGLLIGFGLAFVAERFRRDRQIVDGADLEKTYGSPLLGSVPEVFAAGDTPEAVELFRLIRARLRFSSREGDVRTVLITSAERGAGRTTISRGLAQAAASMGARTLLLEADLRNPTLTRQLALRPGPGLQEVLSNEALLPEAVQSVVVPAPVSARPHATLEVLPSGPSLGGAPAGFIESQEMKFLLADLRSKYDLVVIDAPPLTAASDSFPLLSQVDGVVVVAWVGQARRDNAVRLREILEDSPATLLGTIANGAEGQQTLDSYSLAPQPPAPAEIPHLPPVPTAEP
jgi:capsular exopolysaccharide synthesis family protein